MIRALYRVYGSLTGRIIEGLKAPPRRMYLRVNTLRVSTDRLIKLLADRGIKAYRDEYVEEAVYTLVEGPYRVECETDKYIVVDDKTASSLLLGANLYRPGVLRSSFFHEGEKVLAVTRRGDPVACLETAVSSLILSRISRGIVAYNISSPYRAPRLSELDIYSEGLFYPQGYPSIMTTRVLDPKPGELVVDMNASPGGKTGHIVQLTMGRARVLAFDRSEGKIRELKNTLTRLQLDLNVVAIPHDSRYLHVDFNILNKADRVLIDPPCSNLGVRPWLAKEKTSRDIENLSNYQKQFIKAAAAIAKPGGFIVYSTCTLTLEENEENVAYAVRELGLESVELPDDPPFSEKTVYKGVVGYRYTPLLNDMPGHFIALLRKPGSSPPPD